MKEAVHNRGVGDCFKPVWFGRKGNLGDELNQTTHQRQQFRRKKEGEL